MKGKKIKILSLIVTGLIMVTTLYAKSEYSTINNVDTALGKAGSSNVSNELPFTQEQVLSAAVDVAMNGYKYGDNNKVWFNDGKTYEYLDCSTFIGTVMEKLGCTLTGSYQGTINGAYQFNPDPWFNEVFTYVGPDGNRYAPELVITADQTAENPGWFNAVSKDGTVVSDVLQPGDIICSKSHMFMYVGKAANMEDMLVELKNYNNGNDIETLNSNTVNYAYSNSEELGKLSYATPDENSSEYWLIEGNIGRNVSPRGYGAIYSQRNSANTNRPYLTSFNWAGKVGAKGTPTIRVYRIAKVPEVKTEFTLKISKVDNEDKYGVTGAKFTVKIYNKETGDVVFDDDKIYEVNEFGELEFSNISITKDTTYVIRIEEKQVPKRYYGIDEPIEFEITSNDVEREVGKTIAVPNTRAVIVGKVYGENASSTNHVYVSIGNQIKKADLALTKSIVDVERKNAGERYTRILDEKIDSLLSDDTTADYIMNKSLVNVKPQDIVTYRMRVYNEGNVDSYAKEITDYLPAGLEFYSSEVDGIDYKWEVTENEDGSSVIKTKLFENQPIGKFDGERLDFIEVFVKCKVTSTDSDKILTNVAEVTKYGFYDNGEFIEASKANIDEESEKKTIQEYRSTIIGDYDYPEKWYSFLEDLAKAKRECADRDSDQNALGEDASKIIADYEERINDKRIDNINKKETHVQDDDDFENVKVVVNKELDLALRKSISAVNGESTVNGYDLTENRLPMVTAETSQAALVGKKVVEGGVTVHNGTYFHDKKYVTVKKGDLVTYTIRVYNEGLDVDYSGYAKVITDYLPEGVEFVRLDDNSAAEWKTDSKDGDNVVRLQYTSDKTLYNDSLKDIYARSLSKNSNYEHLYQTVSIICRVTKSGVKLTNRAEITDEVATDREGNIIEGVTDKDSKPGSLNNPTLDGYYDDYNKKHDVETAKRGMSYYPGEEDGKEEDDVDFETVYVEPIGMVGLYKYDEETGKALSGAKFALKADKDSAEFVTEELETDESGAVFFDNLKANQDYYAVETVAPEGYKKIEEPIKVTAKEYTEALDIEDLVKVGNKRIVGMVGLYKYDEETGKALSGAKFALKADKDSDEFVTDELETDESGAVFFDNLEVGKDYYAVETVAPEGFKKIEEPIKVTAREFNEALDIEDLVKVGNKKILGKIGIFKYDEETGKALVGAKFRLKADKDSDEFVTDEVITDKDGKAIFENLELGKTYYIVETESPKGFKKLEDAIEAVSKENVVLEDVTNLVKIGNEAEKTEVQVTKTWDDNDNQDGSRPEKITVRLFADGKEVASKEVTEADGWKYTFTDLVKYNDGNEIVYTVKEDEVAGYETQINGFEIVNKYVPKTTEVNGTKTWNDNGNQDGKRPEKITVRLFADGKEVASKEVSEADEWKYSFTKLAKYSNGKEITYTVKEDEVADYETQINGFDIVNTYNPETTKVNGEKTWNDGGNVDKLRPETLTIYLLADGKQVDSKVISEEDGWKYSFTNLAKYNNGKEIVYTVDESEVEGYTKKIEGFNITNTHVPETTKVEGKKTWNDGDNKYKKRPESITVYLLANGEKVDSVEVSEANNWEYSFKELSPRDEEGNVIEYSVDEEVVEGYTKKVNGYDLINTYEEEFVSVSGKKTWVDENNADNLRPSALRIMLYADGEEVNSTITTAESNWTYSFTNLQKYNEEGNEIVYTIDEESVKYYTKKIDGYDITNTHIVEKPSDLKLVKFISEINGVTVEPSRFKGFDVSPLKDGNDKTTTANYELDKTPILVNKGDVVTYTIRVYNEGNINAYAHVVMDDIPAGLQYIPNDETNSYYGWEPTTKFFNKEDDYKNAKYALTDYLSKAKNPDKMLKAYDGGDTLDFQDLKISFLVISENTNEDVITNHAQIGRQTDENGEDVADVDSVPKYWRENDDDQDIDNIIVTYTDLALRKFITKVNGTEVSPSREPEYDVTPLLNGDTTANYTKKDDVVNVSKGDIVTYKFRVYNEGTKNEFATLIKDDIPEGTEFIQNEFNKNNGWIMVDELGNEVKYAENAKYIVTDALKNDLIYAFDKENKKLDFKDIEVEFKVIAPEKYTKVMTNHAQISAHMDENGNVTQDRDSTPDKWNDGEDDQDIENIKITYADLALKKFITEIDGNELETSREPIVNAYEMKNDENITDATYTLPDDVVEVQENNIVTYTIRIYNEGTKTVAPSIVKDDIPEGLEFIPDDIWTMYDENGNKVSEPSKAKYITTDCLANEFINGFDRQTMNELDYRDVKANFKVLATNEKDRIIINHAQISKEIDQNGIDVDDIDSEADVWNDGEDDQDIEKIRVKYFDLALKKWVSKAIIIENGKERVTETGITDETNPEPVVKVDLKKSKIDNVIVKFEYTIKVTNEGEIAGYPEEIEETIPEGLKFVQEDNLDWEVVDGKIVTHQLENTLLNPGESESVTFVLTWINKSNNLGLKTNVAEISKHSDKNKQSITDIDSTPGNKKTGEDDIDDAPVILTVKTGAATVYTGLAIGVISILGIGIFGIKKYVLR